MKLAKWLKIYLGCLNRVRSPSWGWTGIHWFLSIRTPWNCRSYLRTIWFFYKHLEISFHFRLSEGRLRNFFKTVILPPKRYSTSATSDKRYHVLVSFSKGFELRIKAASIEDKCKAVGSVEEVGSLQIDVKKFYHFLEIKFFLFVELEGFDWQLDAHS